MLSSCGGVVECHVIYAVKIMLKNDFFDDMVLKNETFIP